jgi:hypothetical protein
MKYPYWLTFAGITVSTLLVTTLESLASHSIITEKLGTKVKKDYYAYNKPEEVIRLVRNII